jgi:predicted glycosyltransferase involved in capsule biosynthesis
MDKFWAICTYFNYAGFKAPYNNYFLFAHHLKQQGVNLLTVELAFGNASYQIPSSENVVRLRAESVLWQKERMINYALSILPSSCEYFAWLDSDILFAQPNWVEMACKELKKNEIVQLFKRVYYLPKGDLWYKGKHNHMFQGVIWQYKTHKNWLERRRSKELPFSSPGFAWAANRKFFQDLGGLYDRNIIGSGDTFIVDCILNSFDIHGYGPKFNTHMKNHMMEYCGRFRAKKPNVSYVPADIYHLYHGELKNRRYMERHDIVLKWDYDPSYDIVLANHVYEWATPKYDMHEAVKMYFVDRNEDS